MQKKKHFRNATASPFIQFLRNSSVIIIAIDEREIYAIVHIHENPAQFPFAQIGGVSVFINFYFPSLPILHVFARCRLIKNSHRLWFGKWQIIIIIIIIDGVSSSLPLPPGSGFGGRVWRVPHPFSLSRSLSLRRKTLSIKHSFQKSIEYNFAFSGPPQLPNTVSRIHTHTV